MISNKYPSSAIVWNFPVGAVVDWALRTAHHEADELANGNTRFDPAKRIIFKESDARWDILPRRCRRAVRWSVSAREQRLSEQGSPTGHEHRSGDGRETDFASRILTGIERLHPHSNHQTAGNRK